MVLATGSWCLCASAYSAQPLSTTPIAISGGSAGIGFDDLEFSPELRKVIVPAGRTGKLVLIDPDSKAIEEVEGFSSQTGFNGGHDEGVTSADTGHGGIFATDRSAGTLNLVDPKSRKVLAVLKLAAPPDLVRFVAMTNEVWVTEPRAEQIEVFSLPEHGFPKPEHAATISVPGGPEALVIDNSRRRAYTNLWSGTTVVIDPNQRAIVERWQNGCRGSRGLALDRERGFLLVGCKEGRLESLSLKDGHRLGEVSSGVGVDDVAYNPKLHHAYLPGAESGTMAVIGISADGRLALLNDVTTVNGSHCVAVDDRDNAYICDPRNGKILVFHDQ